MKRILVFLLCLTMLLSTVACSQLALETLPVSTETFGKSEGSETKTEEVKETGPIVLPKGFSAGFARETVNPQNGTAMAGYSSGNNRLSTEIYEDIKATCTAISDGETVLLFYSTDSLFVAESMVDTVTKNVSKYLNGITIPPENVIMNATHCHSAPSLHFSGATGMIRYLKDYYPTLYRLANDAIRDLEEAKLFAGRTETEGLNYVRRYVSIDGTKYIGGTSTPSGQDPTKVRHETEADPELQVIRFDRKTKKDIILCNWQCHVGGTGVGGESNTFISPSWVGSLRDQVEQDLGVLFSYHQGAAGNIASSGKIKGDRNNGAYIQHGKDIAKAAEQALADVKEYQSGKIYANRQIFTATHDEEYKKKTSKGDTQNIYISAISIGEIAFATTPYEMHDTNGMQVKEGSPFKMTFMCAYTNGQYNYVAADHAYILGGYEVNGGRFVRGTGEAVVARLDAMLDELYQKYR